MSEATSNLSSTRTTSEERHPSLIGTESSSSLSGAVATFSDKASVHMYPIDTPESVLASQNYAHTKVLHLIRHAEGTHNVNREYRKIENLDARLTPKGFEQCRNLAERIQTATEESPLKDLVSQTDLIVTSPMTRCIQTALTCLQPLIAMKPDIPIVAQEFIRETVNYNCDRRREKSTLGVEFPQVNLDDIAEQDVIWESYEETLGSDTVWTKHRESAQLHVVADRARAYFRWLRNQPATHVIMCSHAAFLRCLLNFGLDEEVPFQPNQTLDVRDEKVNLPVVKYCGEDATAFEQSMRETFSNCEVRSVVVAFPK